MCYVVLKFSSIVVAILYIGVIETLYYI